MLKEADNKMLLNDLASPVMMASGHAGAEELSRVGAL